MILRGPYAVHLHRNGELVSFLPGDEVPEWAAALITNPYSRGEHDSPVVGGVGATEPDTPAEPPEPVEDDPPKVDVSGAPPRRGPAASRQIWADFAESKGVQVQSDWKRDDIIAAMERAGKL